MTNKTMKTIKNCSRLLIILTLLVCVPRGTSAEEDIGFLDKLAMEGIPEIYGVMLDHYADAGPDAQKELAKDLSILAKGLGWYMTALDVSGNLYKGEVGEAALSAGAQVLAELAGTETGKAYLLKLGMTGTWPLSAVMVTFKVTRESYAQLSKATYERELETLYATIESTMRNRSRKLGEGDPMPVNAESSEKMWKLIKNGTGREIYKKYASDACGLTWPEPSFWDSLTLGTAEINKQQAAKLKEEEVYIKGCLVQLMTSLNAIAKADEQRVLTIQRFQKLQKFVDSLGMSMNDYLAKSGSAFKAWPEVKTYSSQAGPIIEKAIQAQSGDTVRAELSHITATVRDVVRWIPNGGKMGAEKTAVYARLKAAYQRGLSGIGEINRAETNEKIAVVAKEPKPSGGFSYPSLNRQPALAAYQAITDNIKEDGTAGYDMKTIEAANASYNTVYQGIDNDLTPVYKNIENEHKRADDEYSEILKKLNQTESDRQRLKQLEQRMRECDDAREKISRNRYKEHNVLGSELEAILEQASSRALKRNTELRTTYEQLNAEAKLLAQKAHEAKDALRDEYAAKLSFPEVWYDPNAVAAIGVKLGSERGDIAISEPGKFLVKASLMDEIAVNLQKDAETVKDAPEKLQKVLDAYEKDLAVLKTKLTNALPDALYNGEWGINGFNWNGCAIDGWGLEIEPAPAQFPKIDIKKGLDALQNEYNSRYASFIEGETLALKIKSLAPDVVTALGQYMMDPKPGKETTLLTNRFKLKNKKAELDLDPAESDGAAYLKEMKLAWEANKGKLAQLQELRKAFHDRISYVRYGPKEYYPLFDAMEKIPEKIQLYEEMLEKLTGSETASKTQKTADAETVAKIKDLYAGFKDAYESRDESGVMSFISDDWEAGDGTTLSDLQESMRNSFSVFNDIKYVIANIKITPAGGGKYRVSYEATITGRNYENSIKHEEKSTVTEEVTAGAGEKVKISKTLNGKFWYVQ